MLEVIPGFASAAATGSPPDLQFFWNGLYHIENAWRGYIQPLDDLVSGHELQHMGATPLSLFEGKLYRAGWYVIPVIWVANRRVLKKAGVEEGDVPPRTWGHFLEQCAKVKAAGMTPVEAGDRDGDFSVWWLTHLLVQQFDSAKDVAKLFLGGLDWRDPPYYDHWTRMQEVWGQGYINEDAGNLDLFEAARVFEAGGAAFTLSSGPMFSASARALGAESLAVMPAPVCGWGRLAGLPIIDTQGVGISAASRHKAAAAEFLLFMHRPERLQALWDRAMVLPADDRWDGCVQLPDPAFRLMWEWFSQGPATVYIPDLMPVSFHFEAMAVVGKRVFSGELDGPAAGELAARNTQSWAQQHPDEVENYRRWMEALAL